MNRPRLPRPRVGPLLLAILVVNLVLFLAYCWSRGGQTTLVRLEARGGVFTAYVDGVRSLSAPFDAPASGGIILTLENTANLPSLPRPRGIDAVRVTDLASGRVLFQDDFSSGVRAPWLVLDGAFASEDGVLEGGGVIALRNAAWRDYAVDVRYRNIVGAIVAVRADEPGAGVAYHFRPPSHKLVSPTAAFDGGIDRNKVSLSKRASVRMLSALALRAYPVALVALASGTVLVAALGFSRPPELPRLPERARHLAPWALVAALAFGAFGIAMFIMYSYVTRMPHVPDEVSYLFQAKLLSSGDLSAPPPPVPAAFQYFVQNFITVSDGRWASIYPFGHPIVLAIGTLFGAPWLMPPLVGAASVVLLFVIGRRLYATRVGLLAALLLVTSPFFLMTTTNFMAHNTASFYLLLSLLFLLFLDRRPGTFGLLAGLSFGLLFNTRPLTALALITPFGAYLLAQLLPGERRLEGVKALGAFVAGGLVMLAAYWLYNYGTTGAAFTNGYQATTRAEESFGFGGRHSVALALQNEAAQLKLLLLVLHGWPQYVGLMFAALPFLSLSRNRHDWFLGACAAFVMAAPAFWRGEGIMHGPRYWYEATPFLILLAARGADRAVELLVQGAAWLRRRLLGRDDRAPPVWAALGLTYAVVLALVGSSLYGWLLGQQASWNVPFTPARAEELRGLFGVDNRLVAALNNADLEHALVLVEDCGLGEKWYCYGSVAWLNEPTLDGDVVYARDIPTLRDEIIAAFPGRAVYIATYRITWLRPYDPAQDAEPKATPGALQ